MENQGKKLNHSDQNFLILKNLAEANLKYIQKILQFSSFCNSC